MAFAASLAALFGLTLLTGNLIAVTLILLSLVIIQFTFDGNFGVLADGLWNLFNSFLLTALPMFILLGELMSKTGISRRIYTSLAPLFSHLPGQLVQTNIGACTLFSAICGSSQATAAVVGAIAYDELDRQGYKPRWIAGSLAAGGTLGIMIPPSLALIIYGWWEEVSIGRLFVAGIVPGLMTAGMFMAYIAVMAKKRPDEFPRTEVVPLGKAIRASLAVWPFLLLILVILGTMVMGLATPTESAALGVTTTLILAAFYRQLSVRAVWDALVDTALVMSTIGFIIIGATVLSQALALSGAPAQAAQFIAESGLSPLLILLSIYLLYIVLGCMLAAIEMLLITLPFTFPVVIALGYDPVWFGIAVVMLIEIGMLTPPLGMNLFVILAISNGRMTLGELARACIPFWLILMAGLAIITFFPEIALFLPNLVFS
ncbi:MAG: TRAP transporter large permease [Proteobacteria bacterium]|nr:TRAP transporter large permease [Pseudomonadota bacterium]